MNASTASNKKYIYTDPQGIVYNIKLIISYIGDTDMVIVKTDNDEQLTIDSRLIKEILKIK